MSPQSNFLARNCKINSTKALSSSSLLSQKKQKSIPSIILIFIKRISSVVFDPKLKYKTSKLKNIRSDQSKICWWHLAELPRELWEVPHSGRELPYSIVWDYTFQKRTRTRERNWRRGLYAQVMMSIINKMGSL